MRVWLLCCFAILGCRDCRPAPKKIAPLTWTASGDLEALAGEPLHQEIFVGQRGFKKAGARDTKEASQRVRLRDLGTVAVREQTRITSQVLPALLTLYTLRATEQNHAVGRVEYRLRFRGRGRYQLGEAAGELTPHAHPTTQTTSRFAFTTPSKTILVLTTHTPHPMTVRSIGKEKFEVVIKLAAASVWREIRTFAVRLSRQSSLLPIGEGIGAENVRRTVAARITKTASVAHAKLRRSSEPIAVRQDRLRNVLQEAIGLKPFPQRTPLSVQTVARLERGGYQIDKIVFESRPGLRIPAHIYRPADEGGKRPAVLHTVGHYERGKNEDHVQLRAAALARAGFISMTYDPLGYGERSQSGNNHLLHNTAVLVGSSNLAFAVWDSVRAIDYLVSRSDVDPRRIGITGISGGGLNALITAALDERVTATAPVGSISSIDSLIASGYAFCGCSVIPGLARMGDTGDLLGLVAPRPLYVLQGEQDLEFLVQGTFRAVAQARPDFEAYGKRDALQLTTCAGRHEYGPCLRTAMYAFMHEVIGKEEAPKHAWEQGLKPEPDALLNIGAAANTTTTMASILAKTIEQHRSALTDTVDPEDLDRVLEWEQTRALLGAVKMNIQAEAATHQHLLFRSDSGYHWEARYLPGRTEDVLLHVHLTQRAAHDVLREVESKPREHGLLLVELWNSGSTTSRVMKRDLPALASIMGGPPIVTIWGLQIVETIQRIATTPRPIRLSAKGPQLAVAALLAAAKRGQCEAVWLPPLPSSLGDFGSKLPTELTIPNLLKVADLPHLIAACPCPTRRGWSGKEW